MTSLCDKFKCLRKKQELIKAKSKLINWLAEIALVDFENISMYQNNKQKDDVKHFLEWVDHNKVLAMTDEIVSNIDANKQILDLINIKQNEIKDILVKMREIATKAADESYTPDQRKEFQITYDNYVLRINKIQEDLQHNNTKVWEKSGADTTTTTSNDAKKFREVRVDFESSNRYTYNTEDLTSLDHGAGSKADTYDNKLWGTSVVDTIRAKEVLWVGEVLYGPGDTDADDQSVENTKFVFDQDSVYGRTVEHGSNMNRALAANDVIVFSEKSHICWNDAGYKFKVTNITAGSGNGNKKVTISELNDAAESAASTLNSNFTSVIKKNMNVFIYKTNLTDTNTLNSMSITSSSAIKVWTQGGTSWTSSSTNDYFLNGKRISEIISENGDITAAYVYVNPAMSDGGRVMFLGVQGAFYGSLAISHIIPNPHSSVDLSGTGDNGTKDKVFSKTNDANNGAVNNIDNAYHNLDLVASGTEHHLNTLVDKSFFSFASSEDEEQEISRDTAIADALTGHIDALIVKVERKISEHEDDHAYVCQARDNVIRQSEAGYGNLESQRLRAKMKLEMKICNIEEQIAYLDICIKAN